ncbi:unnamed protein product [Aphanomyces euteiches]
MIDIRPSQAFNSFAFKSPHEDDATTIAPFLVKLRQMLTIESAAIFRWNEAGTAFEIVHMELFIQIVLPKYFKQTKYASFQRQLNYFGFKKWTKRTANVCTFSNVYFIRDDPQLALFISRKRGGCRRTILEPLPVDDETSAQLTWNDVNWLLGFDYIADCLDVDVNAWV